MADKLINTKINMPSFSWDAIIAPGSFDLLPIIMISHLDICPDPKAKGNT